MNGTVFATVLYFLGFAVLFSGLFLYKKTETKQQVMTWLPLSVVLIEFYLAFVASLLNLIHIPISVGVLGIVTLLTAIPVWFFIVKKKEIQKFEFELSGIIIDVLFAVALIWAVLRFADARWGVPELYWNYSTVDPAAHFREALEYVNGEGIRHMFFAQLMNGIVVELFSPWARFDYYYRYYVLSDLLQLLLSGFVFYGVVRRFANDLFGKIAAAIVPFFFVFGYALDSTIYGFTYLGISLYIIATIFVLMDLFINDEMQQKWLNIFFLMLAANAIFQCYVLFMPATYLAMGLAFLAKQWKTKKLISVSTITEGLSIFLLPVILGFIYTYLDVFVKDNLTVGSAFAADGASYRDLFSNFVLFAPIAVVGFVLFIKNTKNSFLTWFTPIFLVQTFAMFVVCYKTGKVSAYYFYKNYYVLWLLVFILIAYVLAKATPQTRLLSTLIITSFVCVLGIFSFNVETKLSEKHPRLFLEDGFRASAFVDVFAYDRHMMRDFGHYPDGYMDLYHYVYNDLISEGKTDKPIPICCIQEYYYIYESVTNQRLDDYKYWGSMENLVGYFDGVCNSDYAVIHYDCSVYEEWQEFWDQFEVMYETDYGKVVKIENITIQP